ncbi:Zn 2cys6 transcription factor [Colletotrichum higginsianum IMI 349063]|uniref:Zn 2cys6 transcription factor n=1 Tax=Colletotrichum higginsianum (strain IMI 349063) TaxID=759273 RepID=A0A1B7YCD9_COLHI|nr:Zn 2cys6 transcription factor [Colletotrichum higginsianum IMI 349063]OBR09645.1 Zn 2cys6 transcription factor [Colletotrichum higginsianum IMI 349063]
MQGFSSQISSSFKPIGNRRCPFQRPQNPLQAILSLRLFRTYHCNNGFCCGTQVPVRKRGPSYFGLHFSFPDERSRLLFAGRADGNSPSKRRPMRSSFPEPNGGSPGSTSSASPDDAATGNAGNDENPQLAATTVERSAATVATTHAGEGRSGPRSRNGCWTCRTKKVKCDEQRPNCHRCMRLRLLCDYAPRFKLPKRGKARKDRSVPSQLIMPSASSAMSAERGGGGDSSPSWLPTWAHAATYLSQSKSLSLFSPEAPAMGVCSLDLSSADHEAIRLIPWSCMWFLLLAGENWNSGETRTLKNLGGQKLHFSTIPRRCG